MHIYHWDTYELIINICGPALANKNLIDIKWSSWRRKRLGCDEKFHPNTFILALKNCVEVGNQTFQMLLKSAATLPLVSWECEISSLTPSCLAKSIMTTKRSSSSTLINIHRDIDIDYKRPLKILIFYITYFHISFFIDPDWGLHCHGDGTLNQMLSTPSVSTRCSIDFLIC